MENLRTNNLQTALNYFQSAQNIYDKDCLVYNEQGVVYYKLGEYNQAQKYFDTALKHCQDGDCKTYESILINMGHTYRKLKLLDRAI